MPYLNHQNEPNAQVTYLTVEVDKVGGKMNNKIYVKYYKGEAVCFLNISINSELFTDS